MNSANGQFMKVFNPIIIPAAPQAGDSVFVRLQSWTSSVTTSSGYVTQRIVDSFDIYHCVRGFILTAIINYDDTVFLGVLDTGTYAVHFTMYATSRGDTCEYLDPKDSTTYFHVGRVTGLISDSPFQLDIYPNPANEFLYISGRNWDCRDCEVTCFSISGGRIANLTMEHNQGVKQINVGKLLSGYYVLVIKDGNRVYRNPIWIKR